MANHRILSRTIILATAAATATLGGVWVSSAASAAPKGEAVSISCNNGHTYSATVVGGENAEWTPAHATNGTILIPKAFGPSTFSLYENGVLVESQTDPPSTQGGTSRNPRVTTHCTFSLAGSFSEGGHDFTFTVRGTVSGFVAGRR